jgi:hypothetical protein
MGLCSTVKENLLLKFIFGLIFVYLPILTIFNYEPEHLSFLSSDLSLIRPEQYTFYPLLITSTTLLVVYYIFL